MPNSKFPSKEGDVMNLARKVLAGMVKNEKDFLESPVPMKDLLVCIDTYDQKNAELVEINATARTVVKSKDDALEATTVAVKRIIRYAENKPNPDEELRKIGWSPKRAPGTGELPGRTSSLQEIERGGSWLSLIWVKPDKGGSVSKYLIEWREVPNGEWKFLYDTAATQVNLVNIPMGKTYEYRVRGKNAAGLGEPSNVISITL